MNKTVGLKRRKIGLSTCFIVVFLILLWTTIGVAEDSKVDINEFFREIFKTSTNQDKMTMMGWIPEEYWQVISAQDPNITAAKTEELKKVFRPYILLFVSANKMGPFGGMTYQSEATIRAKIQIKDSEGNRYRPLSEDVMNPDCKNFLLIIKPIFANMFGQMGQNMHFLLFPAENSKGQRIAEAKKEGVFSVELDENEFRWRLPLGSLLMPKICPTCRETLSGAYKFCPLDGTKLSEIKN